MPDVNSANSSSRSIAMGVYVLYLLGAFSGVLWLIGFLVAFVFRGRQDADDLGERHLAHQVRAGLKPLIVWGVLVLFFQIAWTPLLAWCAWALCAWALVVTLKGLSALAGGRAPRRTQRARRSFNEHGNEGMTDGLEDIRFDSNTLKFTDVTGTVLDSAKWSETHVSGGGGGGYAYEGSGQSSGVSISSSTSTQHDIWIKEDSTGKERPVQLSGADVPLRQGQRVTVVFVESAKGSMTALLVNHDAGRFWKLCGGISIRNQLLLNKGVDFLGGLGMLVGFCFGAYYTFIWMLGGPSAWEFAAPMAFLSWAAVALGVWRIKAESDLRRKIDARLDGMGRSLLRGFAAEGGQT